MNIVFVVESEEQLTSGVAWCEKFVRMGAESIDVVIPGMDRNALAENAKRRITERIDSVRLQVEHVQQDAASILQSVDPKHGKTLLLVYQPNDDDLQQELFQCTTMRTIWARGTPRHKKDGGKVISALADHDITTNASERILGVTPTDVLCGHCDSAAGQLDATVQAALETSGLGSHDLVVSGVDEFDRNDIDYRVGLALLKSPSEVSVALLRGGDSIMVSFASRIYGAFSRIAPPMEREARRELAQDLEAGSKPNLEFFGLMSASAMLAAFGLLQNSAAVIIGAMLIAPLMTPIIGAGLALTQGNRPLFNMSVRAIMLGFLGALVASTLFGWLVLLFQEPKVTDEMLARCKPSPLDFCVGLVGGIAASYARTRAHLSSALAGAAIAAALVPPLSTAGLQIAFGVWRLDDGQGIPVAGPLLLATINVLTIMIGSSWVLWARGMRSDPTSPLKNRWTLRTFAFLTLLALLTLIWIVQP